MLTRVLVVSMLINGGACLKAAADGGTPLEQVGLLVLLALAVSTAWPHISETKVRSEEQQP
jgi:cytochrome b